MILKECEIFLSYLEAGEKSHWKLMRYQNLKIADDPHKYEILSLCLNNLIHVLTIARLTDEVNCKWGEPDDYLFSKLFLSYVLLFKIEVVIRKKAYFWHINSLMYQPRFLVWWDFYSGYQPEKTASISIVPEKGVIPFQTLDISYYLCR